MKRSLFSLRLALAVTAVCPAVLFATDIYFSAYNELDNEFEFVEVEPTPFEVLSPPADIDWTRGAMAAETANNNFDLFFFKENSGSELYFYQYSSSRLAFLQQTTSVELADRPGDLDVSSFAVAADSTGLYYYGRSRTDPRLLYRAPGRNRSGNLFVFDFSLVSEVRLAGVPSDVDWTGWAVATFASGDTRVLLRREGSRRTAYEGKLNPVDGDIDFDGSLVAIEEAPFTADTTDFMAVVDSRGLYQLIYPTQDVTDVFFKASKVTSDDWYESNWYGFFNAAFFPWIYRDGLGWFWAAGDEDGLYTFREATNQWFYTSDEVYPWSVDLLTGVWEQL